MAPLPVPMRTSIAMKIVFCRLSAISPDNQQKQTAILLPGILYSIIPVGALAEIKKVLKWH